VDPATGRVLGRLTVGRDPHPPVVVGKAIYMVSPRDNTVTRIDARTNEVSDVEVGTEPYAIAAGAGSIWVGDERDLNVRRLDLGTMAPQAVIDVGEPVRGLAFGDGHLWVTTWTSVLAIDPVTNNVIGTTRLLKVPAPRGPAGLTVIDGAVWVGVEE
jgi:YVTN family beta-propeller protein